MTGPRITPLEAWVKGRIGLRPDRPLTRGHLDRYHLDRLRETIDRARTQSSFYRDRLAGLPSAPIQSLDELSDFPLTSAQDLRDDPNRFLCVSQNDIARVVTLMTSGTTNRPKRIFFSERDLETTLDFFHHGMGALAGPGSRVLILLPGSTPDSVGDLLARALGRLGATGIVHGPVLDPPQTVRTILEQEIDCLVGIPVQVLALVRHPDAPEIPGGCIRTVLLTTDHVPRSLAGAVEDAWQCRVFQHYGMTEMGLGGAVECEARQGGHLREADLWFEVVHPETGHPVPEGEFGEVVFSTLTREAMPLVRYRTGDRTRFIPGNCPCGTMLRRLDKVRGRFKEADRGFSTEDFGIADLDEWLFSAPQIMDYQAEIKKETPGGQKLILTIRPTIPNPTGLGQALERSLARHPAVAGMLGAQGAGLIIRFAEGPWPGSDGRAKRYILEHAGRGPS